MAAKLFVERIWDTGYATLSRIFVTGIGPQERDDCLNEMYGAELSDKNNEPNVSAIPAGDYEIERYTGGRIFAAYRKRWNHKFIPLIAGVEGRSAILIHAISNTRQLNGCIAPLFHPVLGAVNAKGKKMIKSSGRSREAYCFLYDAIVRHDIRRVRITPATQGENI